MKIVYRTEFITIKKFKYCRKTQVQKDRQTVDEHGNRKLKEIKARECRESTSKERKALRKDKELARRNIGK
jgi:hypothetical protein